MHIDLHLPVMVRCQPAATKKTGMYFLGSHIHPVDVPEVSLSETEIAFGSVTVDSVRTGRRVFPVLRSWKGRLYRPIGNGPGMFNEAFPDRQGVPYMMSNPPVAGMRKGPVASPICDRFSWVSAVHGMNTSRNARLWPEVEARRSSTYLGETKVTDINGDDLGECMRMHAAQAERLLLVDGKMWMETTPPCINVAYGHWAGAPSVKVTVGFLPLVPIWAGDVVRFPLGMADYADEYARELPLQHGGNGDVDIARIEAPEDASAVGFDHIAEELHEFAWGIGSNIVRAVEQRGFHKQHKDAPPLFEGPALARFDTMKAELFASNDIIGERGNLADFLPEMMDMWAVAKKSRYQELWNPTPEAVDRIVRRKMELLDESTISLAVGRPGMTFP